MEKITKFLLPDNPEDRFELVEELASGSFGAVYNAKDKARDGAVSAVKIIETSENPQDMYICLHPTTASSLPALTS